MPIISNFPSGGKTPKDLVTVPGGGKMELAEGLGLGPYVLEIDEDTEGGGASPMLKKLRTDTLTVSGADPNLIDLAEGILANASDQLWFKFISGAEEKYLLYHPDAALNSVDINNVRLVVSRGTDEESASGEDAAEPEDVPVKESGDVEDAAVSLDEEEEPEAYANVDESAELGADTTADEEASEPDTGLLTAEEGVSYSFSVSFIDPAAAADTTIQVETYLVLGVRFRESGSSSGSGATASNGLSVVPITKKELAVEDTAEWIEKYYATDKVYYVMDGVEKAAAPVTVSGTVAISVFQPSDNVSDARVVKAYILLGAELKEMTVTTLSDGSFQIAADVNYYGLSTIFLYLEADVSVSTVGYYPSTVFEATYDVVDPNISAPEELAIDVYYWAESMLAEGEEGEEAIPLAASARAAETPEPDYMLFGGKKFPIATSDGSTTPSKSSKGMFEDILNLNINTDWFLSGEADSSVDSVEETVVVGEVHGMYVCTWEEPPVYSTDGFNDGEQELKRQGFNQRLIDMSSIPTPSQSPVTYFVFDNGIYSVEIKGVTQLPSQEEGDAAPIVPYEFSFDVVVTLLDRSVIDEETQTGQDIPFNVKISRIVGYEYPGFWATTDYVDSQIQSALGTVKTALSEI